MQGVYVIHFERPLHHARHYIGWAEDIERRFEEHRRGKGARLTQVVVEKGIGLLLTNVFPGEDRNFERKLKNRKQGPRYCPICNAKIKPNEALYHLFEEHDG